MKRVLLLVALAGLLGLVAVFDPVSGPLIYPRCPVKMLTGLDCPGCGSTRALHALLHGRILEAWRFNLWLPVVLAMAALALVGSWREGRIRRFVHSPVTLGVFVALSLGWMALRNLKGI